MNADLEPSREGLVTPRRTEPVETGELRGNVLDLLQLSGMSISSVGPVFSIAAAVGPMIAVGLYGAPIGMWLAFLPFLVSAVTFRHLNRHLPNAGASYGWTFKALGPAFALVQAWMVILAYFFSLMAIIIPAGTYTLSLLAPAEVSNNVLVSLVGSGWAIFAAIPLIWGIVPTARFTAVFLATELVIICLFFALGFFHLAIHGAVVAPSLGWFVPTSSLRFGSLITVAVVGFTIVDGWELDSHAAEEAKHRRTNPGTGGLIGLLAVTAVYVIAFFLFFTLSPIKGLVTHQTDVLAYFSAIVAPAWATKVMLIGILASTASGLWLTHFILNRSLFAMARDQVIPRSLGRVHRRFRTPWLLVLLVTVAEVLVTTVLTNVPNVSAFFSIMLQTAGLFLSIVFVFSNLSALIYFRHVARQSLHHFLLLGVLPVTAVVGMLVLIGGYLVQQTGTTLLTLVILFALTAPFVLQVYLRKVDVLKATRELADDYAHPEDEEAHVGRAGQFQAGGVSGQ
ncbi:MAG: APC family permease [Chloroflexota bacterium]|nr:APC family permease [Chloroflexota bacterium]